MKISTKGLLVLFAGFLVVATWYLYQSNSGQTIKQQELLASISNAQAVLPKLTAQKEELQQQLAELESRLAEATSVLDESKVKYPETVESIEYDERLFQIAYQHDVMIIELIASEPEEQEVGSVTYVVTFFELEVRGEVIDIINYIGAVITDDIFSTVDLEVVNMLFPEPLSEGEKAEMTEEQIEYAEAVGATINLTIYSYRGG
ncbi:hypothetical protein ACFLTZ_07240 [Chloroflexota bacterium]